MILRNDTCNSDDCIRSRLSLNLPTACLVSLRCSRLYKTVTLCFPSVPTFVEYRKALKRTYCYSISTTIDVAVSRYSVEEQQLKRKLTGS